MSAHIETLHHALCFDCGWEEVHGWSDEARDAMDAHNAAHHSTDSQEPDADACSCGRWGSSPWVHPRWCRAYGNKPSEAEPI